MASGTLRIRGTLDVAQFWPSGTSDADTVKVTLSGPDAFAFQPHPGARFKTTRVFDGAVVKGRWSRPPVDAKGRMTVRLQGVDAPELHYQPSPAGRLTTAKRKAFDAANGDFRQALAEASTIALGKLLAGGGATTTSCEVRTAVDDPNEVFDTYGRAIGDVFAKVKGRTVNVNHWLVQRGWAFPTYYASMSAAEIQAFESLAAKAEKAKRGAWASYESKVVGFDFGLRYRSHGPARPDLDKGPVLMPKLFRRQSTWAVSKKAGLVDGTFTAYAKAHGDSCFETADFLEQGPNAATVVTLDRFLTPTGEFTVGPGDVVFREAASKLARADGKPVAGW